MKPSNSEITISQKDQHSKIGMLLGGHGLETLRSLPDHVPPETVEDITRSWPDLLHTRLNSKTERDVLQDAVDKFSKPAPKKWIIGRIAALLLQYFQGEISEQMMRVIADDWCHEMQEFPAWAIAKSVRWYISRINPDRRRKPLPGDISDIAQRELGPIFAAKSAIRRFDQGVVLRIEEAPAERMSKERAEEIMAEVWSTVKKFGH
mgnify:FL=1